MRHLVALVTSHPWWMGAPDQNIITSPIGTGSSRPQAISASDGSYAMVYSPDGGAFDADLSRLAGRTAKLSRFDPRTGTATDLGIVPTGLATYTAPTARLETGCSSPMRFRTRYRAHRARNRRRHAKRRR